MKIQGVELANSKPNNTKELDELAKALGFTGITWPWMPENAVCELTFEGVKTKFYVLSNNGDVILMDRGEFDNQLAIVRATVEMEPIEVYTPLALSRKIVGTLKKDYASGALVLVADKRSSVITWGSDEVLRRKLTEARCNLSREDWIGVHKV